MNALPHFGVGVTGTLDVVAPLQLIELLPSPRARVELGRGIMGEGHQRRVSWKAAGNWVWPWVKARVTCQTRPVW